ncbi:MAG: hypothetical protein DRR16_33660 [Candidatus Parabeggiatoa sp. nov. 3]|nr:MAG: hypothetical protein DRQ99_21510 [Gammaproteobacteria bacterium]RKZ72828.1 MAG: hypothetical protein DRR16_33660 [Gammaproteobacteria bacterium]
MFINNTKYRRHKYHAVRTRIGDIAFDSKKEARRYQELIKLEEEGHITELTLQPAYMLQEGFKYAGKTIRPIQYFADFQYKQNGKFIVEDTKGVETDVFKLKRKMFWFRYPELELRVF